jgi:hypothetical protein
MSDQLKLDSRRIKDMKEGEIGYTVPWSVWRQKDGSLWIGGDHRCFSSPRGTIKMRIKRISDCVQADAGTSEKKYRPFDQMFFDDLSPIPAMLVGVI